MTPEERDMMIARRTMYDRVLTEIARGNGRLRDDAVSWGRAVGLPRETILRDLLSVGVDVVDARGAVSGMVTP